MAATSQMDVKEMMTAKLAELSVLRVNYSVKEDLINKLKAENEQLKTDMIHKEEDWRKEKSELQHKADELKKRCSAAQTEVKNVNSHCKKHIRMVDESRGKLIRELEMSKEETKAAREKSARLEADIQRMKAQMSSVVGKMEVTERNLTIVDQNLTASKHHLSYLNRKVTEMERNGSNVFVQCNKLSAENANLRGETTSLAQENVSLRLQLTAAESMAFGRDEQQCDAVVVAQKDEEIAKLKQKVNHLELSMQQFQRQHKGYQRSYTELVKINDAKQKQIVELTEAMACQRKEALAAIIRALEIHQITHEQADPQELQMRQADQMCAADAAQDFCLTPSASQLAQLCCGVDNDNDSVVMVEE